MIMESNQLLLCSSSSKSKRIYTVSIRLLQTDPAKHTKGLTNRTTRITSLAVLIVSILMPIASSQSQLELFVQPHYDPLADVSPEVLERSFPLSYFLKTGKYDAAIALMPLIADLNIPDDEGLTPLSIAASDTSADAFDMVQALLEHGADPRMRDDTGVTPLHYAAMSGSLSVVQLLVDRYSAEADAPRITYRVDSEGKRIPVVHRSDTPLVRAARSGNLRVAKYLEQRGATVPENQRFSLKMRAIRQAYFEELAGHLNEAESTMSPDEIASLRAAARVESVVRTLRDIHAPSEVIEYQKKMLEYFYEYHALEGGSADVIPDLMAKAKRRAQSEVDMAKLDLAMDEYNKILEEVF